MEIDLDVPSLSSLISSPFLNFWRIVECLGDLTTNATAYHRAQQTGEATSPPDVELPGVALLDGYLPLALALVLILSSMFVLEARVEAYHMTFGGFLN